MEKLMSLPLSPQPDCASAWLAAVTKVDGQPRREAHNVLIDVQDPIANTNADDPIIAEVEAFLRERGKSVRFIANTIFPEGLYRRHGAPDFIRVFHKRVLPKVRKSDRWSGYYFERMTAYPRQDSAPLDQLWGIVERIRNERNRSRNKFEVSLFDPERDVDDSPYGGQCLSFLSFKLLPGAEKLLALTAMYRNHYYIEKLLGNLIGLGRLMAFVAAEGGIALGPLTVLSTHAQIDQPGGAKRSEIAELLARCVQAQAVLQAA
jgi:thymidylate synthase